MVNKLHKAAKAALESEDVKTRFAGMGGQPGGNTPAEFAKFIEDQQALWADTVKAANLKMD